jgi:tetratricopeptide (TPR) repeat protein
MRVGRRSWRGSVVGVLVLSASAADARPQQADPSRTQALYQQGERALSERRYTDAAQAYERLQQLQPGVAEVHARLGLIYFQQGRFAEAVAPLRRALKLNSALPNVDSLLAMSLSEIGRHDEALPALEKAFHHQSTDSALRRIAGLHLQRTYTDLGRDSNAVAVALELSRLYPDDPEVLYHTGRLFGNYAYLQMVRLARIAPDSVWLHQAAGEANESQGLLDEAIKEYQQVLAMSPKRPGLHFRIGRALLMRSVQAKGDAAAEASALSEFEQELQIDPSNANASYEIGEMHRKSGELDKAIGSFRKAVESYPEFEEALVGLGRTLVAAGDSRSALPHLQKAISVNPRDEVAFYQLAQAHRALGQEAEQQKALAAFDRLRSEKARHAAAVPAGPPNVTKQAIDPIRRQ